MILVTVTLSDHLPKHVREFGAGGGHSLLWPKATTFLNNREPIRDRRPPQLLGPQGFICHKSLPSSEQMVTAN